MGLVAQALLYLIDVSIGAMHHVLLFERHIHVTLSLSSHKELPGSIRSQRALHAKRRTIMTAIIRNKRDWLRAAIKVRSFPPVTPRLRLLNACWLAAIIPNKPLRQLHAPIERKDRIIDTMDPQISNRIITPITPTNHPTTQNTHSPELLRPRASKGVTHSTTPGETRREARALVYTEITLNLFHNGVDERYVFAVDIGPAGVQAIGRYEDCTALRPRFKAVPGLDAVAADDVVHVAAAPVESEDEVIWVVCVVVVGDFEAVFAAVYLVDAIG